MSKRIFIAIILLVGIMSCLLTRFILPGFLSSQIFSYASSDFENEISDFYIRANHRIGTKHISSEDICIVYIDSARTRYNVAKVIEDIARCDPKIIGLDVYFSQPGQEGDCYLQDVLLQNRDKIVFAVTGHCSESAIGFDNLEKSFFLNDVDSLVFGFDNFITKGGDPLLRNVLVQSMYDNTIIPSFAKQIVNCYNEKTIYTKDYLRIEYLPTRFNPIRCISDINSYRSALKNKIVLIGGEIDYSDMHLTPIGNIPGIDIHAHIIESILRSQRVNTVPIFYSWLFAVLFSFIFAWILLICKIKLSNFDNLVIRLAQVLLFAFFLFVGAVVYIQCDLFVNFSPIMGVVILSAFSFDIIYSIFYLLKLFK